MANGFVAVRIDLESCARGDEQEGEHMAARNGGDESFFGVDIGGIGMGNGDDGGGRGGGNGQTAVEGPGVFARVLAVEEVASGKTPIDDCKVVGHVELVSWLFRRFPDLGRVRIRPVDELGIEHQSVRSGLIVTNDFRTREPAQRHALDQPGGFVRPIDVRRINRDAANRGTQDHIDSKSTDERIAMNSFARRPINIFSVDDDVVRRKRPARELFGARRGQRRRPDGAIPNSPINRIRFINKNAVPSRS